MLKIIKLTLALAVALLVSCAPGDGNLLGNHELIAGVAAAKATVEIIERAENQQARAARILIYTATAEELVDSSKPVTLQDVYQAVHDAINWEAIPPIDRMIVEDLLQAVRDSLAREAERFAILSPEAEVSVIHIIRRIRETASFYA